jgi:hypothetical protein
MRIIAMLNRAQAPQADAVFGLDGHTSGAARKKSDQRATGQNRLGKIPERSAPRFNPHR